MLQIKINPIFIAKHIKPYFKVLMTKLARCEEKDAEK
jgi:hypothetical protein